MTHYKTPKRPNVGVMIISFVLLASAMCFISNYFISISDKNNDIDISSIKTELLNSDVKTRTSAESLVYKLENEYEGFSAEIETDKQNLVFNAKYKNKEFKVERLFN